jgi:hypothetical protein
MPSIEDEFETLSEDFTQTFRPGGRTGGITGTLTRVSGGTFSAATGTESTQELATLSLPYVRHGDARIEEIRGRSGAPVKVEVVEYFIDAADLASSDFLSTWPTAAADAIPRIGDTLTEAASPNGDGKVRQIVEVRKQLGGKGYKLRTEVLLTA